MAKRGRKPKWDTHIKPRLNDIKKWASEGMLEEEIIKKLGVGKSTFYDCKAKYSELSELIVDARQNAVYELEKNGFKMALGYTYEEEKMIIQLDEHGNPIKRTKEITKKHQPGNGSIYMYLMNNWAKENYSKDPIANKFREEELKLKKIQIENNNW